MSAPPAESRVHTDERTQLIETLRSESSGPLAACGEAALSESVLNAIAEVPRSVFVPQHSQELAYANTALTIGHGQTISQPLVVALMTHLLCPDPDHVVLEVGTGSGYQAAVLAQLVRHVYSVEIIQALELEARERLRQLHYGNITLRRGDGASGWPEHAPYDGIIVTAAAETIPAELLDQLRVGGRLVAPVGPPLSAQWLTVTEKQADGLSRSQRIASVRFVPLTGSG